MIIEARNLSKKVIFNDQEIVILDDINLEVSASSSLAVIGPSGSGKSTLLGILAGLDSPSSGEIFINQTPLHNLSEDARAKIRKDSVAFVFQNFELLAGLNALENVMLPIELKGKIISSSDVNVEPEDRNISLAFQENSLFPHYTVEKNILLGLEKNKSFFQL